MRVRKATYLGGYKVKVLFTDGTQRTADFGAFLQAAKNPMITKFRDPSLFASVEVQHGTLSWNGGEMDIDPLTIYKGDFSRMRQVV